MGQVQTIRRIWANQYPNPQNPREHSLIEKLFCTAFTAITLISLSNIKPLFGRFQHVFMDVYVILWVAIDSIILFSGYLPTHLAVLVAVYRLIDIVSYRMFFIFVKSQERPWSPDVLRRSVLIVLLNFYECVACFALLYLRMGCVQNSSGSVLDTPATAFYYSLVTMTTLGYGDYLPNSELGRELVVSQLATVIIFLVFLLPALMSVFSGALSKNSSKE
jgi:hypothetical protein